MGEVLRENTLLITFIVMVIAWLLLRTRATRVESNPSLGGIVGGGQPTVLEFFSNT